MSTVDTRSRSEFDDMICSANRAFIVFNNDNGIADISQFSQGLYHLSIVLRMQTDTRFIKDVEHTHQS